MKSERVIHIQGVLFFKLCPNMAVVRKVEGIMTIISRKTAE